MHCIGGSADDFPPRMCDFMTRLRGVSYKGNGVCARSCTYNRVRLDLHKRTGLLWTLNK